MPTRSGFAGPVVIPRRHRHGPAGGGAGPRDVDELCAQFAPVCESAVDPLEICCALEFEGWSDKAARDRYGLPDVFALAEQMYLRVPRRPAEPDEPPDPWQVATARPALHGLLYGLPTVCFPAAAGLLAGPGVVGLLVVVSLVSWAISQSLAYLGYLRLGQADPALAGAAAPGRAGRRAGRGAARPGRGRPGAAGPRSRRSCSRPGWGRTCWAPPCSSCSGASGCCWPRRHPACWAPPRSCCSAGQRNSPIRPGRRWRPRRCWPWRSPRRVPPARPGRRSPGRGRHAVARRGRPRRNRAAHEPGGERGRLVTGAELRGALPSAGFGLVARGTVRLPGGGRPARPCERRPARLAAAGDEHGRGRVDAHLVPAAHPAAAARHRGTAGVRHPGRG